MELAALAGAGGLRSTATDLLVFLGLHAHGSDATLAAAARDTRRRRARLGPVGVGLGWLVLPPGAGPRSRRLPFEVLVHEGGTGGFRSFAAVAPETSAAVVVLVSQARSVSRLGMRVLQAVIRKRGRRREALVIEGAASLARRFAYSADDAEDVCQSPR